MNAATTSSILWSSAEASWGFLASKIVLHHIQKDFQKSEGKPRDLQKFHFPNYTLNELPFAAKDADFQIIWVMDKLIN